MKYPLVRELAAEGFSVTVTCQVLMFSTQGYCRWLKQPWSGRDYENAYLTTAAYDAHRSDPAFGYRLVADEIERLGLVTGERRVWSLYSEQHFWSSFVKKSRSVKHSSHSGFSSCPNLIARAARCDRDCRPRRTRQACVCPCSMAPALFGGACGQW